MSKIANKSNQVTNKINIMDHSDNELSLIVFNDEFLYKARKHPSLKGWIDDSFEYTPEQLEVLKQDLIEEMTDNETEYNSIKYLI